MVISQSIWAASYTLVATIAGSSSATAEPFSIADAGFIDHSYPSAELLSAWIYPQATKKIVNDPDIALEFTELQEARSQQGLPLAVTLAMEGLSTDAFIPLSVDVAVVDAVTDVDVNRSAQAAGICEAADSQTAIALPLPEIGANGLYQVSVGKYPFIQLPDELRADWIAQRLRYQFEEFPLDSMTVQLFQQDGVPAVYLNGQLVVRVNHDLASYYDRSADLIAIDWANNLRIAIGQDPLTLAEAQQQLYGLSYTGEIVNGIASWYGPYFHGRLTATGEIFDQSDLTAAHPSLPFGTYLEVINHENDQSVIVRINDRGPYIGNRSLDLSYQAAQCLDSETSGVVDYTAYLMTAVPQVQPASPDLPGERLFALEREEDGQGDREPG
jgi:hypothetical protein